LIVGLTSVGRVSPNLPLPSILVVNDASRDEGPSLHYLAPTVSVRTPTQGVVEPLITELSAIAPHVCQARVWTTDAPYRETREQLEYWATPCVLAVEMQAASLFAFAQERRAPVAVVAMEPSTVSFTGVARFSADPSPSCPEVFLPARAMVKAFIARQLNTES
jgi:uridine phosphorylase